MSSAGYSPSWIDFLVPRRVYLNKKRFLPWRLTIILRPEHNSSVYSVSLFLLDGGVGGSESSWRLLNLNLRDCITASLVILDGEVLA